MNKHFEASTFIQKCHKPTKKQLAKAMKKEALKKQKKQFRSAIHLVNSKCKGAKS